MTQAPFRQAPDQTLYAEYGRQASGATDNTKDTNAQEKTIFTGVNVDSIYSGVFDVNNILIHVAQNFVNIIAGTALWSFFGWLNLPNQRRRSSQSRSLDDEGFLGGYSASDVTWLLRKIADTGDIIASLHDELWFWTGSYHKYWRIFVSPLITKLPYLPLRK